MSSSHKNHFSSQIVLKLTFSDLIEKEKKKECSITRLTDSNQLKLTNSLKSLSLNIKIREILIKAQYSKKQKQPQKIKETKKKIKYL